MLQSNKEQKKFIWSGKRPSGMCLVGEMSVGEVSGGGSVWSGSFPDTSPTDTFPTDISPIRHIPDGHFPNGHFPENRQSQRKHTVTRSNYGNALRYDLSIFVEFGKLRYPSVISIPVRFHNPSHLLLWNLLNK